MLLFWKVKEACTLLQYTVHVYMLVARKNEKYCYDDEVVRRGCSKTFDLLIYWFK